MDSARADGTVRLAWPGRTWKSAFSRRPRPRPNGHASHGIESFGRGIHEVFEPLGQVPSAVGPFAALALGDGLEATRMFRVAGFEGAVDLVYVDPPYFSQAEYVHEARLDGSSVGRAVRATAYDDRWRGDGAGLSRYLEMLAERLDDAACMLSPKGTMWVHLDWRASYLARTILDEIFGRDAFINEIVWRRAPNLGRQATSAQFGRTFDTILVYGMPEARIRPPTRLEPVAEGSVRHDAEGRAYYCAPRGDYTDESIAKLDSEGRVHRTASGRVYVKYFLERDEGGRWARRRRIDALWTDVAPLRHAPSGERTGYPTQKPRALLDRIVEAATERGDVVLDVFGGSGTSAESAVALGRYALYADKSPVALATAKARLLRANAPYVVLRTAHQAFPAAVTPKVRVHSYGAGCQVELREPAEPLAWMVGRLCDGTFRVAAHSVRHLGARAAPVSPSLAVSPRSVEAATKGGAGGRARENLHVRIVMDDGSEGEVKA